MRITTRALSTVTGLVLGLAGVRGAGAQQPRQAPSSAPEIVVSGRGEVRVRPDRATLLVIVETRARTAAEAGADNARRQRSVLDTLRRLALGGDDVSTIGYTVAPDWRVESGERRPRQNGYVAQNGVRVELRELDRLGAVIDATLGAGANRLGAIQFRSSHEHEAQLAALDSAVAQARSRATVMARAVGGTLGSLIRLSTEPYEQASVGIRGVAVEAMYVEGTQTPINPGELSVVATILGRWEFTPGAR